MGSFLSVLTFAFAEAFFVSGYAFVGLGLMAVASTVFASGSLGIFGIFLAAGLGTYFGSVFTFLAAKYLGGEWLLRRLDRSNWTKKAEVRLSQLGLFVFVLVFRFPTFIRPIYPLFLGSIGIGTTKYMIAELFASVLWAGFWSCVLYVGQEEIKSIVDFLLSYINNTLF